ncbi:NrfD/PsrC family molybdoenzyme membrane anchor subunit [Quadrisphaera sp. DSM 44207]|uniref:NrfD/PsrC family molybdoenzyme membrane anchor subunit n=1 Tax=Quadrisphaera sp. DSM 44207 TaxID=1881057 RepID=UPI000B82E280|nr:NrfD/PsrC family molybdoenzyme membrane anchor subunit [Quadrisphaera sp. DSM 44207]
MPQNEPDLPEVPSGRAGGGSQAVAEGLPFERHSEQGTGRRGGRRRRSAETLMVPEADFTSYYGRQVIHTPAWKVPDVPAYLYLGGLAGASSVLAALADATGRPSLRRAGRLAASGGSVASVVFLIHDLGRPTRFLNMLRVFKVTSPLSVGSWILSPFSTFAGVAAVAELPQLALPVVEKVAGPRLAGLAGVVLPWAGSASGVGAALFGPPLATYTAVLLADTAVPSWHEAYPELPFVFAGSGMAAAGGVGMIAAPTAEAGPARRLAALGAGLELAASTRMERRLGLLAEPYEHGRAGRLLKLARAALATGAVGALVGGRSRAVSAVAGALLNTGAALTRFGVYDAGVVSAKDPKYTIIPQRQRLDARRRAQEEGRDPASADDIGAGTGKGAHTGFAGTETAAGSGTGTEGQA